MINLRKLLRVRAWLPLAALAASISMAGQAWADLCPTASLATYIASGFSCTIDDKTFSGFTATLTAGGSASTAGVGISLTPITTVLNPGFNATLAGFTVGANQSLDLKLAFNVAVNPGGNLIEDVSLGIAGAQNSGSGLVAIGENVCVGGTFANPGAGTNCSTGNSPPNEITLNVQNPGPPPVNFDMKLTTLASLVGVFKDVSITGGAAGSASLSSFSQQFSEHSVPEPASLAIFGAALIGLGWSQRRRRKDV